MPPASPSAPDVSIAIVNFETPAELDACLRSIVIARESLARAGRSADVFVVDNASRAFAADAVTDVIGDATVLRNDENVGFARAANRALRLATGRYVLVLNPDTVLAPDTLGAMVTYMDEHPDVGCSTARLVLPDGSLDLACRRSFPTPLRSLYRLTMLSRIFPRSRRFGQYNLTYLDERSEADVDSVCGAFMFVRREAIERVGLLDERYFMYGEDLDWAFRMKRAGWRITYTPRTTVRHVKRASSRHHRTRTIRAFHDAMRIFFREHYEREYPRPVAWLVYGGIKAREIVELAAARLTTKGARA
jgi:hypothetical protein